MENNRQDGKLTTKGDLSIAFGLIGVTTGIVGGLPIEVLYKIVLVIGSVEAGIIGIIIQRQKRLKGRHSRKYQILEGESIGGKKVGRLLEKKTGEINQINVTHFTLREPNEHYDRMMNALAEKGVTIHRVVYFRQKEEVEDSPDDYQWLRDLKNKGYKNVKLRTMPLPDEHEDIAGNHVPPIPLRRDILVVNGELAVVDLPRPGVVSKTTDFPNCLVIRGEEAKYFETLFNMYWDDARPLYLDDIPEYG